MRKCIRDIARWWHGGLDGVPSREGSLTKEARLRSVVRRTFMYSVDERGGDKEEVQRRRG